MSSDQNRNVQTKNLAPFNPIAPNENDQKDVTNNTKWDPQDFHTLTSPTKGTYSTIHLVQSSQNQKCYALKARYKSLIHENCETDVIDTEKNILLLAKKDEHPFIIEIFGGFQTPSHILLYLEFCEGGSLSQQLQNGGRFGVEKVKVYTAEICLALKWLHGHNFIYRALSLHHTLLAADGHVKLIDFVVSKVGLERGGRTGSFCGQMEFLAPEMLLDKEYDTAIDWWQLGVMTYQMLTGSSPFKGEDQDEVYDSILSDELVFPEFMTRESVSLVKGLIEKQPGMRLGSGVDGAEEVMAHTFFDGVKWDDVYHKRVEAPFVSQSRGLGDVSQDHFGFVDSEMDMARM